MEKEEEKNPCHGGIKAQSEFLKVGVENKDLSEKYFVLTNSSFSCIS